MKPTMFPLGLTSVTFRGKSIPEVASLAKQAGLSLIEWGGDIHVPPSDRAAIAEACRAMQTYGLSCPSYGSYYRVGDGEPEQFRAICETAAALGAETVRTWLGRKGSALVSEEERATLLGETRSLAAIAESFGLTLAFEFHGKTYNDTGETSLAFWRDVARPNVKTYWQPLAFGDSEANLRRILPALCTVHVFHWDSENSRFPLADGIEPWRCYLSVLRDAGRACPLLLEFVQNDDEEQFLRDARTLAALAAEAN